MPYATEQDIIDAAGGPVRILKFADWDGNGTVDAAAIALGQDESDMMIDGHAGIRFRELLNADDETSTPVRKLAGAEALYRIKVARNNNSPKDDELAEARLRIFQDIRDGKFLPKELDEDMPETSSSDQSEYIERDEDGETWSRAAKW